MLDIFIIPEVKIQLTSLYEYKPEAIPTHQTLSASTNLNHVISITIPRASPSPDPP
jgi:hypothetical protein